MTAEDAGFDSLGLHPDLVSSLAGLGYEAPTPIQTAAIPQMISGRDLLCQAATGTGKTAAFALPIVSGIGEHRSGLPTALVLAPTRELCVQVAEAVHRYGRPFGVRTLPVYGGQPIGRQITALKRGVDIVVATPGRALDLLNRKSLKLNDVATVVLDEADEMLDMGFAEDIEEILSQAPADRQTVMFSATMPKRILRIAKHHLDDPLRIEIEREVPTGDAGPKIRQVAYVVARPYKAAALGRILDVETPAATLVFCRTRAEVDQLAETLNGRGYRAEALHGGMDQSMRDRVMGRLRSGGADLLVATDVAARGLDVDHLTHVVNFDVPAAPESYVHRIGRVGRGDRTGTAITIAEPRERRQLAAIERSTGGNIEIGTLPTSAQLRERRLELTRASLAVSCLDDDLERYRPLLEALTEDAGIEQVALAAIKTAHLATVGEQGEAEIPEAPEPRTARADKGRRSGWNKRDDETDRRRDKGGPGQSGKSRRGGPPAPGKKRIFINAGNDAGIRPADIVGAIANETGLPGSQIGPIDIRARHTTVDVPDTEAAAVIKALGRTRVKGQRVKARKDRDR
ncbi:MAG: DEAD/DEAH box helicase [Actinobacteria bacterium]|nr:DEAD/DEAH box helicase [Actinomycetota bacterium]